MSKQGEERAASHELAEFKSQVALCRSGARIAVISLVDGTGCPSQLDPLVRPRSATSSFGAELDDYLEILEAPSDRERVKLAETFAEHYLDSGCWESPTNIRC